MQVSMDKNTKASWSANKLIIRNYSLAALQNPQATITALLLRLHIALTNNPCVNQRLKAEFLGRQARAHEHHHPEIQRLEFADPVDTRQLNKRASDRLIGLSAWYPRGTTPS